jgi:hypothetical protein
MTKKMNKRIEELLAEEDDDAEALDDEDDGDCAFCLGREAAHRGEGEDQNPFPKTDARKGSIECWRVTALAPMSRAARRCTCEGTVRTDAQRTQNHRRRMGRLHRLAAPDDLAPRRAQGDQAAVAPR